MIKNTLIGLVSALALIPAANAADIYGGGGSLKDAPVYVAAPTWAGFYLGVNGGYAWSADNNKLDAAISTDDDDGYPTKGKKGFDLTGGFGGGQIGYNWQRDRIVYGVEADFQGAGLDDKGALSVLTSNTEDDAESVAKARSTLDWFGTVRGRVGYAFDRSLIYVTGGFAYGQVKDTLSVASYDSGDSNTSENRVTASVKRDDTATGYVIGGGYEQAFTPAWSLKVEYQYIDLGSDKLSASATRSSDVATASVVDDHTYHTVRIGLNYHVHNDYVPLK